MLPVARTIHREEAVTGIVVGVELVGLTKPLECLFSYHRVLRRRAPVLPPEEPEQGTPQVSGVVERGHGLTPGEFLRLRHHTAAVAIDRGVNAAQRTGRQVHLPATGTIANNAHFAIEIRQGAEIRDGPFHVPHGALVRHTAGSTHAGTIFFRRAFAFTEMQVRRDGDIAVVRKLAGNLLRRLVPARHMMDDYNSRVRTRSRGTGQVRVDQVALMPVHVDGFCRHGFVWHSVSLLSCGVECVETIRLGMSCEVHSSTARQPCQKKYDQGHAVFGTPACPSFPSPCKQGEGAPLNWRPSAVADAGNGLRPAPTQSRQGLGWGCRSRGLCSGA